MYFFLVHPSFLAAPTLNGHLLHLRINHFSKYHSLILQLMPFSYISLPLPSALHLPSQRIFFPNTSFPFFTGHYRGDSRRSTLTCTGHSALLACFYLSCGFWAAQAEAGSSLGLPAWSLAYFGVNGLNLNESRRIVLRCLSSARVACPFPFLISHFPICLACLGI